MKKAYRLLLIVGIVALSACSTVRVSQDYELSRNFDGIKSYDWRISDKGKVNDPRINNSIIQSRLKRAVETALSQKGIRKKTDGAPDIFIDYDYRITSKIDSDNPRTGFGFGVGSSGSFGGVTLSTGSGVNQYEEGFLIINLIDPSTHTLLWRGNGTHKFKAHTTPSKREALMNELVNKILEQFPPEKP